MKCRDSDNPAITLSELLSKHTKAYLDSSNEPKEAFLKRLVLPVLVRDGFLIEPEVGYEKWRATKCRNLLRNIYDGFEFKSSWILPWLSVLPEPHKSNAMQEFCGLLGSYYAPITPLGARNEAVGVNASLADISKEFGSVLQHSGPAIDGTYDPNDKPEDVQLFVDKLHSMIGIAILEIGKVYQGTGIEPAAYRAMSHSSFFKK